MHPFQVRPIIGIDRRIVADPEYFGLGSDGWISREIESATANAGNEQVVKSGLMQWSTTFTQAGYYRLVEIEPCHTMVTSNTGGSDTAQMPET